MPVIDFTTTQIERVVTFSLTETTLIYNLSFTLGINCGKVNDRS